MNLIIAAVDRPDPRPLWYCDWGTARRARTQSNLKRALDRVLKERGPEGLRAVQGPPAAQLLGRVRRPHRKHRAAVPALGRHVPPELDGKRWYHRFSALTATAGGFDLQRDVLTGHGPLGALYPTNTTHPQKEGDTMTFLYLVPTGMNDPEQPTWGSWAGRYGPQPGAAGPALLLGEPGRTPGRAPPTATTPWSAGPSTCRTTSAPAWTGA